MSGLQLAKAFKTAPFAVTDLYQIKTMKKSVDASSSASYLEVNISGRLDFQTVVCLLEDMETLLNTESPELRFVFNLSGIQKTDSSALLFLLACCREAKKKHRTIVLEALPETIKALICLSNLQLRNGAITSKDDIYPKYFKVQRGTRAAECTNQYMSNEASE